MKLALVDVDGHNFPNLALMKIAHWHKTMGAEVEWYNPLFSHPDSIYASKVFTFTKDYEDYNPNDPHPFKGGTGYNFKNLPWDFEQSIPDYSIYPDSIMRNPRSGKLQAFGFLTRGCFRDCPWCIVPQKEGNIKEVDTIERIAQDRDEVVLMDNNFLAADDDFVTDQLLRIKHLKIKIDFNQGLDARLVTMYNAKLLSDCRWVRYIRFSCDSMDMVTPVNLAVKKLRSQGCKREIFCYMLVQDVVEAETRLRELVKIGVTPFAQPYRDNAGTEPTAEQKRFAAFANIKGGKLCLKMQFKDYYH